MNVEHGKRLKVHNCTNAIRNFMLQDYNIFISVDSIQWFKYFNNKIQPKHEVLLKAEIINKDNLIVARKINNHWLFGKFLCFNHFMIVFNNCDISERTFYAILTHNLRYLYIDINFRSQSKISVTFKEELIDAIIKHLHKFSQLYGTEFGVDHTKSNWIAWEVSKISKFSLHLIDIGQLLLCKDIKKYMIKFYYWILHNNLIDKTCKIEIGVYNESFQLWRLPYNHNGDKHSMLQLYGEKLYEPALTLDKQFKYNFMNFGKKL